MKKLLVLFVFAASLSLFSCSSGNKKDGDKANMEQTQENMNDAADKAMDKMDEAKDEAMDKMDDAKEEMNEKADSVMDKVDSAADDMDNDDM